MSYILDALKKSDRERKRGDVPNLQTVHIPITVDTQPPKILYGFISVLLLVLALMIGMMISSTTKDEGLSKIEEADSIEESKVKQTAAINKAVLVEEKASRAQNKNLSQNAQQSEKKEMVVKQNKQAVVAIEKKAVKRPEKIKAKLDLSDIPYLHEMPDYVQQSIPQLNIAGHVYSTSSENRSVIINNYVMSEGEELIDGIKVVEITTSGVVFSLQGELFRIDVLQDWSFE